MTVPAFADDADGAAAPAELASTQVKAITLKNVKAAIG